MTSVEASKDVDADDDDDEEEEDLEKLQAEIARMEEEAARITRETEELEKSKASSAAATSASAAGGDKKDLLDPKAQALRDAKSVYVGQVDYATTPVDLLGHFEACGTVERVTIVCDKYTGRPKGMLCCLSLKMTIIISVNFLFGFSNQIVFFSQLFLHHF